jgi:hypothetical protein
LIEKNVKFYTFLVIFNTFYTLFIGTNFPVFGGVPLFFGGTPLASQNLKKRGVLGGPKSAILGGSKFRVQNFMQKKHLNLMKNRRFLTIFLMQKDVF